MKKSKYSASLVHTATRGQDRWRLKIKQTEPTSGPLCLSNKRRLASSSAKLAMVDEHSISNSSRQPAMRMWRSSCFSNTSADTDALNEIWSSRRRKPAVNPLNSLPKSASRCIDISVAWLTLTWASMEQKNQRQG